MKKTIYLAGKIEGLSEQEAMDWRYEVRNRLYGAFNVRIPEYSNTPSQSNEIWDKDYYWLDHSDILLVNFDYERESPFLGTSMEIARAYYQRKPIIIFSNKNWVKNNFTLKYHATCIVNTLDDAIDFANSLL